MLTQTWAAKLGGMLHVTNGDSAAEPLRQIFPDDEVLPWRDVLHEGPVPAELPAHELREVRARFLADRGWAEFEATRADLARRDATMEAARGEVVLWFEHDLYDQLQLLDIFHRLRGQEVVQTSMICIGEHPEVEPFYGLGQLSQRQLAELLPRRQQVSEEQFHLAGEAWSAFRAPDPTGLVHLLATDTSRLPFLAPALRRHLEQFPGSQDGLSRSERQMMSALVQGRSSVANLFRDSQHKEEAPFAGDTVFFGWLEEMAGGENPLLRIETPRAGSVAQAMVEITAYGREVLAGRVNAITTRGIDRWLGGVHLHGGACPARPTGRKPCYSFGIAEENDLMSRSRILLVDDNRDLADGLAMFLEDEGYQVTVAYTGEAAVFESQQQAFDVALIDFKLPGINGLETSLAIHKLRPETQAFIMTGFRLEQLLFEIAGSGTVSTLHAPLSDKRLLGALERVEPEGILLVFGNDSSVANKILEVFSAASRRVALVKSPGQATQEQLSSEADMLLLDLGLPLTKSFEALFHSREQGGPAVSVIVANASLSTAPASEIFRSRAVTGCFFKPFDLDELLEVVAGACAAPIQEAVS